MEDDEAASGAPEWFAFRQTANVAQAFGHDAAGMGEISMPIPARGFSRGWRTRLLFREETSTRQPADGLPY